MQPARTAPLIAAPLCALGLLAVALGQEPAPAPAQPAQQASPAPADSQAAQPQPAAKPAAGAPSVTPAAGAPVTPRTASKDDEFIPTEELGADEEVTFPVDI